ncbi:MAG: insulinase family protein [Bacteroidia bacterium]|nr:insulinase family protein [Bacteroidia bacterium]
MEAIVYELQNGLRVIYKYIPYTKTVHCGYAINAGSRDDMEGEMGMAHFIEHMIFKGTTKRKTFHILNYLESVGGDLNAYTTKEKTFLYASMVSEYFERATELLTDITFNSTFPEKEIVKEKQVIAEEIDHYRNIPDEAIFEDFDEMLYPNHSLGHPILGTKDSIGTFTKDKVKNHLNRSFIQGQVVYSIVGNVSKKKVEKVISKYLSHIIIPAGSKNISPPPKVKPFTMERNFTADQAHVIIGTEAYPLKQENYVPFLVLDNLLGGPSMNSKLSLNIRERYGLTYNISSFYAPYIDSGIWGIYYAAEKKNIERIRKLVWKELNILKNKPLGIIRLSQAKKQLTGQLTLGYENLLNQMLGMAKDLLDFGKVSPFDDFIHELQKVSAQQIQDAANEIFQEDKISTIVYKAG